MDLKDGVVAVKAARKFIEFWTEGNRTTVDLPESFSKKSGVFVTVLKYPSGDLRGCIGYSEPILSLREALENSALSVCHDPRFPHLTIEEAKACTVEVTILTPPKELKFNNVDEMLNKIELGKDGVIMDFRGYKGLYLPQVPIEQGWDKQEMMFHLSEKAGLNRGAWIYKGTRVWTFQGEIFSEVNPSGEVVRK